MQKARINIITKEIGNFKKSVYLDYYSDGKRIRESLRLYLLPETSKKNIAHNKKVMKQAEEARNERLLVLTTCERNIEMPSPRRKKADALIVKVAQDYAQTVSGCKSTVKNISALIRVIVSFKGENTKLSDIDTDYCAALTYFMRDEYQCRWGNYSKSTASCLIYLFSSVLSFAVSNGLMATNPMERINVVKIIPAKKTDKVCLTTEELKTLMETPCPVKSRPQVKQAFLLAAFTGMSVQELVALKWRDIKDADGISTLERPLKKISLVLAPVAKRFLPETTCQRGLVFDNLPTHTRMCGIIKEWAEKAGITKTLRFSVAQNTFVYLLLVTGSDISTICSLTGLGARAIDRYVRMTRKYAVEDKNLSNNNTYPIQS